MPYSEENKQKLMEAKVAIEVVLASYEKEAPAPAKSLKELKAKAAEAQE